MQEEDTRVMIGTCLSMFIHERFRIKFVTNNDMTYIKHVIATCIVITKHGLTI
jgi:hypothetical protein